MSILSLPSELVTEALSLAHPSEVACFALTSRSSYEIVYRQTDAYLWRKLYLAHPFDDLRKSLAATDGGGSFTFDWRRELEEKLLAHLRTSDVMISTVMNALPCGVGAPVSADLEWVYKVLRSTGLLSSSLPEDARERMEEIQKRARLSVYAALTLDGGEDDESWLRLIKRRTKARCAIYDFDHYSAANLWGPYCDTDATPNWIQLNHILNLIGMNLDEHPEKWPNTRPPRGLEATRAYSAPGMDKRDKRDWAGIEGKWYRFASFMDYRDLFAFNFTNHLNGPKNAIFFSQPGFQEATKLIELSLTLVEGPQDMEHLVPRNLPELDAYPALYFKGSSRGIGNEASIEGTVQMGTDRIVRWRFLSIHDGRVLWSSEGIQMGNVGSAIGALGIWTGAGHDRGDPVGSFWLWKPPHDHPSHQPTN